MTQRTPEREPTALFGSKQRTHRNLNTAYTRTPEHTDTKQTSSFTMSAWRVISVNPIRTSTTKYCCGKPYWLARREFRLAKREIGSDVRKVHLRVVGCWRRIVLLERKCVHRRLLSSRVFRDVRVRRPGANRSFSDFSVCRAGDQPRSRFHEKKSKGMCLWRTNATAHVIYKFRWRGQNVHIHNVWYISVFKGPQRFAIKGIVSRSPRSFCDRRELCVWNNTKGTPPFDETIKYRLSKSESYDIRYLIMKRKKNEGFQWTIGVSIHGLSIIAFFQFHPLHFINFNRTRPCPFCPTLPSSPIEDSLFQDHWISKCIILIKLTGVARIRETITGGRGHLKILYTQSCMKFVFNVRLYDHLGCFIAMSFS